jgi:pimeloyl-ACP methyl ester carboxylesterase
MFALEPLEHRQMLAAAGAGSTWTTLWFDGRKTRVGFTTPTGNSAVVQPGRAIWIVAPGWTEDLTTTRLVAQAIDRTSRKDQVLILDWSNAAATTDVVNAARRLPTVAQWAANTLKRCGVVSANLNLVGHSLGAYMADQVARRTSGGANRIVALDPATPNAADLAGTHFAQHSRFALAFVGSSFASKPAALTADETVRLNVGDFNSLLAHGAVPDLFASMTLASVGSRPGRVSPLFSVTRLTASSRPKWKSNAFDGGYEAVLVGKSQSGHYQPVSLTYTPRKGAQPVTIKA